MRTVAIGIKYIDVIINGEGISASYRIVIRTVKAQFIQIDISIESNCSRGSDHAAKDGIIPKSIRIITTRPVSAGSHSSMNNSCCK